MKTKTVQLLVENIKKESLTSETQKWEANNRSLMFKNSENSTINKDVRSHRLRDRDLQCTL